MVLGSIPLPSYVISPVAPEDRISRKYSFKVLPPLLRGCNSMLRNCSKNGIIKAVVFVRMGEELRSQSISDAC